MGNLDELQYQEIETAVEILKKGGVILFPTDTVYGLGCRMDRPTAIQRIKKIKRTTQYLPILVDNINQVHKLAFMDNQAIHLANIYWPGGLTIILKSKRENEKIGIRMPNSNVVRQLIDRLGIPIIGTSANFHGAKAVYSDKELDPKLVSLVDYVIKGECDQKIESTVVDATLIPVKVLREGAVKIK
ncbi:threonylcarbamoyl-AMP synthase [Candidatus Curtissbacteria bacterium RBG_13_35_7]|uniref:L-threonylcarbamoyladenylate synthase n=1 Tax=Candidatus Curtissbacteria bacterium RBG_13_35_7 TaxID=1797705 RepID=A0A1F5G5G0_9BACT|nr:MAG: threonylcarbamoyl-AMP synthase [Candidatus Curtissbacteria bacterium RBG_13_35_7]